MQPTGKVGFQAEGDEVSGSMAKYLSLRKCWGCGHCQACGRRGLGQTAGSLRGGHHPEAPFLAAVAGPGVSRGP